jgi:hypothetical protein
MSATVQLTESLAVNLTLHKLFVAVWPDIPAGFAGRAVPVRTHWGRPVSRAASGRLGESPHEASPVHNARHQRRSCATMARLKRPWAKSGRRSVATRARGRSPWSSGNRPPREPGSGVHSQDANGKRARGVDRSTQERQPNNQVLRTRYTDARPTPKPLGNLGSAQPLRL